MFRDEFVLPPNAPLSYVDSDKDRGRWMSWRPRNSEAAKKVEPKNNSEESAEESKEESQEEEKQPQTPVITIHNDGE